PEGQLTDAQMAAGLSPDVANDLAAAGAPSLPEEGALEAQARQEVEGEGATIGGLAAFLGDTWDWMLEGAASLGATIAEKLVSFIMLPDYQLGRKLGFGHRV